MRRITVASAVAATVALGACGSDADPETPVACLGSAAEYVRALEAAPGEVRLDRSTPIGACLVAEQEPGTLEGVGQSLVGAATTLNVQARRERGGEAAVQLGYLSGAVDEAADSTGGIHQDLRLRLASAARFVPGGGTLPGSFERAFAEGYAAGRGDG